MNDSERDINPQKNSASNSSWAKSYMIFKICKKSSFFTNRAGLIKVRAAGFLSGISLFSDFGFWKLAPGFYWFSNFKNSFAGFYCFLRFGSNSVLFSSFFSVFALKTPKNFPPAAGGILLFLKKFRLRRGLIFLQNP